MFHSLVDTINLHKPAYVQSTDPSILTGFQGAGVGWIDTSLGSGSWAFKIRNNANTGWEVISGGGGGITSIGNTTPTTLNSIIYGNDTVTGNVSIGAGLEFISGVLSSTISGGGGYSTLYGGNDITITGALGNETISFINSTGYSTITPVQSDWNETLTSALDYIKNKPSIPTQGLTSLVGGAGITINNSGNTDTITCNITQGLTSLVGGTDIIITNSGNTDTISFSNPGYITSNQNITLSGDVSGSGATSIDVTLDSIVAGGTYQGITFNQKGLVTNAVNENYLSTLYGGTDISITGTDTINFTGTIPTLIGGNDITVISAGGYDTISFINSTGYSTITPVQSDWNETLTSALDYIKNKPSIPTQGLTSLVGGAGITINNSGTTDTISTNLIAGSNVTITSGTGGDTISANGNYLSTLYGGTGISITGTDTITNTLPAPASPNTAYNQNFYTSIPLVDATPGVAGSNGVSYGDHVHPTDTSRQSALTAGQLAAITLVLAGL